MLYDTLHTTKHNAVFFTLKYTATQ